ncbi:MAG: hypothetical protein JNK72_11445 [Myxococcales bacterium]|nr:hypothetical protein [Myxococcales bacterium]
MIDSIRLRVAALSPRARRLISALVAVGGVVLVGQVLAPETPREVPVEVRAGAWRGSRVEGVRVRFRRRGEVIRELSFVEGVAGRGWAATVHLPLVRVDTEVELTSQGRVYSRAGVLEPRAGEIAVIEAPSGP